MGRSSPVMGRVAQLRRTRRESAPLFGGCRAVHTAFLRHPGHAPTHSSCIWSGTRYGIRVERKKTPLDTESLMVRTWRVPGTISGLLISGSDDRFPRDHG